MEMYLPEFKQPDNSLSTNYMSTMLKMDQMRREEERLRLAEERQANALLREQRVEKYKADIEATKVLNDKRDFEAKAKERMLGGSSLPLL